MPRKPRNIGASVRARLLDRARSEKSDFQILLTRYALEEFRTGIVLDTLTDRRKHGKTRTTYCYQWLCGVP